MGRAFCHPAAKSAGFSEMSPQWIPRTPPRDDTWVRTCLQIALLMICVPGMPVRADEHLGSLQLPKELKAAEIEDKAGANIPLDIEMIDQDGRTVTLGTYVNANDKRPVVLTLGYYGCPMLCSVVIDGLIKGFKQVSFQAGKDYRIVSATIDDREQPDLAKKKQEAALAALGISDPSAWTFHVMKKSESVRLAEAVGFNFAYDQKTDQFAHGAGFFILSPNGVLSRTFFGVSFKPSDIKLALTEASLGRIGSFVDRVLLSCFHYDPDSHRYGVYVMGVMRLSGILTIIIIGVMLLLYFRGERKGAKSLV